MSLSEQDRQRLAIEERWWRYPGAKEAHVREVLGESPTVYYARLMTLLDDPDAEAEQPQVVRRLRRLRDRRRLARTGG